MPPPGPARGRGGAKHKIKNHFKHFQYDCVNFRINSLCPGCAKWGAWGAWVATPHSRSCPGGGWGREQQLPRRSVLVTLHRHMIRLRFRTNRTFPPHDITLSGWCFSAFVCPHGLGTDGPTSHSELPMRPPPVLLHIGFTVFACGRGKVKPTLDAFGLRC